MTRTTRPRNRDGAQRANGAKSATAVANRPGDLSAVPPKPVATVNSTTTALMERQSVTLPVSHEQIARAAYELWQQRGGSELENWLDAETQLHKQSQLGI